MIASDDHRITAHEVLWRAEKFLAAQGVPLEETDWHLSDNLNTAEPYMTHELIKPRPWSSLAEGARLRLIRKVVLKLIRPSSDLQDELNNRQYAINEGLTNSLVRVLETARSMADRLDVLERRVAECEKALANGKVQP